LSVHVPKSLARRVAPQSSRQQTAKERPQPRETR
jgi:hypothetical protein